MLSTQSRHKQDIYHPHSLPDHSWAIAVCYLLSASIRYIYILCRWLSLSERKQSIQDNPIHMMFKDPVVQSMLPVATFPCLFINTQSPLLSVVHYPFKQNPAKGVRHGMHRISMTRNSSIDHLSVPSMNSRPFDVLSKTPIHIPLPCTSI